jgi:hypothetical protein
MTNDEQPNPDQTGTWEPNMNELAKAAYGKMHNPIPMGGLRSKQVADAVITEYRRQQAENGMVEVRREDLAQAHYELDAAANWYFRQGDDAGCQRCHDLRERLADATEQP